MTEDDNRFKLSQKEAEQYEDYCRRADDGAAHSPASPASAGAMPFSAELMEKIRSTSAGAFLANRVKQMLQQGKEEEIAALGDEAVPALIQQLKVRDPDFGLHNRATAMLIALGPRAIPGLLSELRDPRMNRTYLAGIIEKIGYEQVSFMERILCQSILNRCAEVSGTAAEDVSLLVDATADERARIRQSAVWALGVVARAHPEYDLSAAGQALADALRDDDNFVRATAIEALGEVGGAPALPALIDVINDKGTCGMALVALCKIAEREDIDLRAVEKALKEHVDSVEREGDIKKTIRAKKGAARDYMQISRAAAKFRAKSLDNDGVILVGELPKPPRDRGIYRAEARRSFA